MRLGKSLKRNIHAMSSMHLSTKLYITCIITVILPMVTYLALFSVYSSNKVTENNLQQARNSHVLASSNVFSMFGETRQTASALLQNATVRHLVQDQPYNDDFDNQKDLKSEAYSTLYTYLNALTYIKIYFYVDSDYTYIQDERHFFSMAYIEKSAWFTALSTTSAKSGWYFADSYEGDNTPVNNPENYSENHLSYITKVVDLQSYSHFTAILRIDVDKSVIINSLQTSLPNDGCVCALYTNSGEMLAAVGNSSIIQEFPLTSLQTCESWEDLMVGGKACKVMVSSLIGTPWRIVSVLPLEAISNNLFFDSLFPYIFVGILFSGLIVILSILTTKNISARIKMVAMQMSHVKSGILEQIPASNMADEIGELINSYNYMVQEIMMLLQNQQLSHQRIRDAESRALQAQINPHFLYNTLEMISYHTFESKPEVVDKIVNKLANFYRLSLNLGHEIYQVWQEISLVENYFEIQQIRYPHQLKLLYDIHPDCLQCYIPKITLQLLVENAINHGILEKDAKSGYIKLSGEIKNGILILSVEDNGVGMTPEYEEMLNHANQQVPSGSSGSGYGVLSINERLSTYYGPGFGVKFTSTPGKGCKAEMRLPAN